jgi:hypothetical protein
MERGTPPATVHKTPVPAQVMHSRILRRLKPLSLFEVMPISFEAVMLHASRSEISRIYSRTYSGTRVPLDAPAMAWQLNSQMDFA